MNAAHAATAARIGLRIKQTRLAKGLSHDKLADRMAQRKGVRTSRQHLIKIEKGIHLPGGDMLGAIADALGKKESYFTSDDDEESEVDSLDSILQAVVERRVSQALAKAGLA